MRNNKRSVFLIVILAVTLLGALFQANAYLSLLSNPLGLVMFFDALLMLTGVVLTWFLKKIGVYLTIASLLLGFIFIFGTSAFNINALVAIVNILLFYLAAKPVLNKV